jgi:hypothetical protein
MKNIYILSKDKPTLDGVKIYITSDEEIKEGDYFYQDFDSIIHKCYKLTDNYVIADKPSDYPKKICKKIILTTDQELIKDGVQAIDDEFLEWFVKNPSCEEVEVELERFDIVLLKRFAKGIRYKIIIPKEESKQFDIRELNRLDDIEIEEISNDWETMKEQVKQETLEEAKQELKVGDNTNFGIITDIKEYSVCFGKNKVGVDIWYKKLDVKLEPKQETLTYTESVFMIFVLLYFVIRITMSIIFNF